MKKGIFTWIGYPLPFEERIRLIKHAGFETVMLWWYDDNTAYNGLKTDQPAIVRRYGLTIENAHLPYNGIGILWKDSPEADAYEQRLADAITECAAYQIPTVVMHITNGSALPELSSIMIQRIKRLAGVARSVNVRLALENLKVVEALDYLLANIADENVGFCFDSGHHNCYAKQRQLLDAYGERLFAIHLHDNFADSDMHMLPYDGNINWPSTMRKIKSSAYQGSLTLELEGSKFSGYHALSAEQYLAEAYQRVCRLDDEK
ncbi:MAG: sugar phosphate isomerase/epimerase family protein [Erysipelotrichaceae bacterium]|nr:sugar phosphate isomerase/epimerase family protein [Erysipelotrichaceae bacterium]